MYAAAKHTLEALGAGLKDSLALPSKRESIQPLYVTSCAVLSVALEDIRHCLAIHTEQNTTLKEAHSSRQQHKRHKSSHRIDKAHLKRDDPTNTVEPEVSPQLSFEACSACDAVRAGGQCGAARESYPRTLWCSTGRVHPCGH